MCEVDHCNLMANGCSLVWPADFATGAPSLAQCGLYGLLALLLGANAWSERGVLARRSGDSEE